MKSILVFLFLFIYFEVYPQKAEHYYARGYYYLPVDREKAIDLFTEAIEKDSTYREAYFQRGLAFFKSGNYTKAIDDFTRTLTIDPELAQARLYRGFAYKKLDIFDKALEDFKSYGSDFPADSSAFLHILSGKTAMEQKDYKSAYEDFTKAIKINPDDESYIYYRFLAALDGGMYNNAINDINRLINLNPQFYGYYFQKGNLYFKQGLYKEAENSYNMSLDKNPYNPDGFYQKGLTYEARGEYEKAISEYSKAILLDSQEGLYFSRRGNIKYNIGDKSGACNDWEEAGKLGFFKDYDKIKKVCN